MDVNDCHTIEDSSVDTIRLLGDLIESSRTEEHMVYREAELDELWRILRSQLSQAADTAARSSLAGLIAVVVEVHDLVAVASGAATASSAAARLRTIGA